MRNIELFDAYTAEIFKVLYESFPVCKDIHVEDIIKTTRNQKEDISRQIEICSETIHWLRDSEMISIRTPSEKDFYLDRDKPRIEHLFTCVVLTAKGLQILKQVPRSIREGASLGDEISSALKQGLRAKASELVGVALGSLIAGAAS